MKKNNLARATRLAALAALQVVLSRFLSVPLGSTLKFSLGFIPVMLAGALEGVPAVASWRS